MFSLRMPMRFHVLWIVLVTLEAMLKRQPRGSDQGSKGRREVAPIGTHGRTDIVLVRSVLGERQFPKGCRVGWDGLKKAWFASVDGRHLRGGYAPSSRFSDKDAIEHLYHVIIKHAESCGRL